MDEITKKKAELCDIMLAQKQVRAQLYQLEQVELQKSQELQLQLMLAQQELQQQLKNQAGESDNKKEESK